MGGVKEYSMSNWAKGLDISYSRASVAWFADRFIDDGYRVFIQDLWTGGYLNNPSVRAVAEANLRDARQCGYACAGYANAAPPDWWPDEQAVSNAKFNAGAEWEHLDLIVVDVEIIGVTWERVFALAQAFEREGKRVCIYTGKWVIDQIGQPPSMPYKLWTTGRRAYSPWSDTEVIGQQLGETAIAGVTFDYDDFDLDFFQQAQPQEEDIDMDKLIRFEPYNGIYLIVGGRLEHLRDAKTAAAAGYDLAKTRVVKKTDADYGTLAGLPVGYADVDAAEGAFNQDQIPDDV
jgi:hypothetical protein